MEQISRSRDWLPNADARGAATFIDCLFAFLCMLPVSPVATFLSKVGTPWWGLYVVSICLWSVITMFVYAALESSKLRATPGKLICGLVVIRNDGERLSFLTALKRNSIKYSMNLYGLIPLFSKGWAADAAIHDFLSGSSVVSKAEYLA